LQAAPATGGLLHKFFQQYSLQTPLMEVVGSKMFFDFIDLTG